MKSKFGNKRSIQSGPVTDKNRTLGQMMAAELFQKFGCDKAIQLTQTELAQVLSAACEISAR